VSSQGVDCEKYNEAALARWKELRFTAVMVRNGEALGVIERALREQPNLK